MVELCHGTRPYNFITVPVKLFVSRIYFYCAVGQKTAVYASEVLNNAIPRRDCGAYYRLRGAITFFRGGGGGLKNKSRVIFCMVFSAFWELLGKLLAPYVHGP